MTNSGQTNGAAGGSGENSDLSDMTLQEAVKVLLEEISIVRDELKGEIQEIKTGLSGEMQGVKKGVRDLREAMNSLKGDVDMLRMEVHQNQTTFIKNHQDLTKRVEDYATHSR